MTLKISLDLVLEKTKCIHNRAYSYNYQANSKTYDFHETKTHLKAMRASYPFNQLTAGNRNGCNIRFLCSYQQFAFLHLKTSHILHPFSPTRPLWAELVIYPPCSSVCPCAPSDAVFFEASHWS